MRLAFTITTSAGLDDAVVLVLNYLVVVVVSPYHILYKSIHTSFPVNLRGRRTLIAYK